MPECFCQPVNVSFTTALTTIQPQNEGIIKPLKSIYWGSLGLLGKDQTYLFITKKLTSTTIFLNKSDSG